MGSKHILYSVHIATSLTSIIFQVSQYRRRHLSHFKPLLSTIVLGYFLLFCFTAKVILTPPALRNWKLGIKYCLPLAASVINEATFLDKWLPEKLDAHPLIKNKDQNCTVLYNWALKHVHVKVYIHVLYLIYFREYIFTSFERIHSLADIECLCLCFTVCLLVNSEYHVTLHSFLFLVYCV